MTGGAGFIGSHIADGFIDRGDEVFVIDDLSTGLESNVPRDAHFERMDIASRSSARRLKAMRPDLIVHCAAQASVPRSFSAPADDAMTNIVGTIRVLEGAIAAGTKGIVFLATGGALYGDSGGRPATEDRPPSVQSPYGLGKWAAEQYLTAFHFPGSPTSTVLRLANVYGPRQRSDGEGGVVSVFIDRMRAGRPIEVHGDGLQTRDFVYVGDVVDAVIAAASYEKPVVVNIGTGIRTSVNQLVTILVELTGFRGAVDHGPSRQGDVRHSSLDPSRAATLLSWHAVTKLREGLERTLGEPLLPSA